MSDVELATKVAEAGGRVFIGFKDPEAAAGVDEMGRVLASRSSVAAAKALLRGRAVELEFEFIDMPTVIARIPSASVGELRHHALIEYIEPIFPGSYLAQDTTWNVHRVNAPDAWSSSSGSDVKLLITDSGIDNAHPDLAPAVVQSCETPPSDGIDRLFHGTAVAGIAAAVNNDAQIVGTAHGVALWSSRIGRDFPDAGFAACAVQFGRVNGVHVINLSIDVTPNTGLTDQINAAYNQDGIVIVAAAGNRNGGPVAYPATLGAVIAVSAIDTNNNFASFSAAGPQVELTAPGTTVTDQRGLTTTCLGGTVASTCAGFRVQGTSFAAPHVAAAAAILKSFNPAWTNVEIRDRLQRTAIDLGAAGRDNQFGFGLIDIRAALDFVPPPPPNLSISGPTLIEPGATCTWEAVVTGVPPFTYSWSGEVDPTSGTEQWYTGRKNPGVLGDQFDIRVDVTDANGSTWDQITVTENPNAPVCIMR